MDDEKIARVKNAVRNNFEASPDIYEGFEAKYGFFQDLNARLLVRMSLQPGARVLDVGCGTGSSTAQILESVPDSVVWGLDISPAMLAMARSRLGETGRVKLVEGDAARIVDLVDVKFDAIVYSASIFLVPDFEQSLVQARECLQPGGTVGLTFMDGVYDTRGRNVLAVADSEAQEGISLRRPVQPAHLHAFFRETFPLERSWNEDLGVSLELLRDFYSVPAMSAGLFPKIDYPERVRKVERLFDKAPSVGFVFRWLMLVGQTKAG